MKMSIKDFFPDYKSLSKDEWFNNIIEYGNNGNDFIEIRLYRGSNGEYSLEMYDEDESLLFCKNVSDEIGTNDFERARVIGTIWDKNRYYFDKMIEGVTYCDRELTDSLLCHVYDFINWSKYDVNTLGADQVEDALQMFIFNLKYERILLKDVNYDEVHKGFVAGLYRATDEEIRQANIMWANEESDDCIGYYEEAFDRIRGN